MIKGTVFYDCGHGGIHPNTGKYVTAPSKMFKHEGFEFYEGVKNREFGMMTMQKLSAKGILVVPVFHEWEDTPLSRRTMVANLYNRNIQKGIYVSEHSNATPSHKARGFSIWTSPGQTMSDVYATEFIKRYTEVFGSEIRIMKDMSDKDPDYEAKFHVLTVTDMPAVLFENLFFDNEEDVKLLLDEEYKDKYTTLQADWIEWCLENM